MTDFRGVYFAFGFAALLVISFLPFERLIADFGLPSVGAVAVSAVIILSASPLLPAAAGDRGNIAAIRILTGIIALYILWLIFAVATMDEESLFRHAKGELNIFVSVLIGFAAVAAFRLANKTTLALLMLSILLACYVGFVADAAAPGTFNLLKFNMYGEFYEAQDRDIAIYGAVRPTFLFFEPSFAGIFVSLVCATVFACVRGEMSKSRWVAFGVLVFLFLYLVRSPTILAGPLAILGSMTFSKFKRAPAWGVLFGVALLGALKLFEEQVVTGLERLNEQGFSTGARFIAPWRVLLNHLDALLFLGSGLNVIPVEWLPGSAIGSDITYKYAITNSFAEFFIAHGVAFGSLLMLLWLRAISVSFRIRVGDGFVIVVIFWSIIGGVVSVMNWLSLAVMFSVVSSLTVRSHRPRAPERGAYWNSGPATGAPKVEAVD